MALGSNDGIKVWLNGGVVWENHRPRAAVRDEDCLRLLRLFNEPQGKEYLVQNGLPKELVENLELLGISSIANLLAAIKMAKYYEFNEDDIIFTNFTDSAEMYLSRLEELNAANGAYTDLQAALDREAAIKAQSYDNLLELIVMVDAFLVDDGEF